MQKKNNLKKANWFMRIINKLFAKKRQQLRDRKEIRADLKRKSKNELIRIILELRRTMAISRQKGQKKAMKAMKRSQKKRLKMLKKDMDKNGGNILPAGNTKMEKGGEI